MARDMTSPTLDALVKELRGKALRDCVGQQVIAEKTAEWKVATELTRLSKENSTLRAELAEAKRALKLAKNISGVWKRKAKAAEASLAAAKERMKALEVALGPFAEKATAYEQRHPRTRHPLRDTEQITHRLGDFRAARAALAQKE